MDTCRTFVRGKEKYSLSEKKQLGELISNHKKNIWQRVKRTGRKDKIWRQTKKTCTNKTKMYCRCCKWVLY